MIENLDNQEALIWEEALEYAYKQDVNLWKKTRNFVNYAIELKGVLYPNKFIIHYCIEYIEKTYPDFDFVVPNFVGSRLNDFLKSKGANAINIREENKFNLLEIFKKFDKKQLEEYYDFLDSIIENFGLQENDQRLVFNFTNKTLVFTIGQRYILYVKQAKSTDYKFRVISETPICDDFINFDGSPEAYLNRIQDFNQILRNSQSVFNSIEKELNRAQISGYSKYNKRELERMAFDIDFRKEILSQLETQSKIIWCSRNGKNVQHEKNCC